MEVMLSVRAESCIRCGKCAGVPVENFYAASLRRRDRIARDRVVYRVRALRGRLPDRFGRARGFSAAEGASGRSGNCALARTGDAAVQGAAVEPGLTAKPVPEETLDRILEGRPPRPDRQQPATGGVYAGDRSRKTARDQRVYCRRIRFDSQKNSKIRC